MGAEDAVTGSSSLVLDDPAIHPIVGYSMIVLY
jgi:hypothetical protein